MVHRSSCSEIIERERELAPDVALESFDARRWRRYKQWGFSDPQIADLCARDVEDVAALRRAAGVVTTFKTVDTCAAEFEASTPYHYSTYEDASEVAPSARDRVIILGSGPNRIGQGIEFDYCCVHASFALRDMGYETVMVNCNPETVSTDYSTSDRLYFEPLTPEDVAEVIAAERAACVDGARVARRDRLARGTDAAQALALAGPRPRAGHAGRVDRRRPRTANGGRRSVDRSDCASRPATWRSRSTTPGPSCARSATRSWCARATCWADGRWRSSTTTRRSSG